MHAAGRDVGQGHVMGAKAIRLRVRLAHRNALPLIRQRRHHTQQCIALWSRLVLHAAFIVFAETRSIERLDWGVENVARAPLGDDDRRLRRINLDLSAQT